MAGLLFVPQALLDEWIEAGAIDVTSDGLQLPSGERLPIEAAYRFVELLDGEDAAKLIGTVQLEGRLREMGAEPYGDSVLLGEVVYQVLPGFVARTPAGGSGLRPGPGALNEASQEEGEGADRLAEFFP